MKPIINDRVHFLSEASKILSSSLNYNYTLSNLANLVVRNIGDFCIIDLLDNKRIMKRVTAHSHDMRKKALAKKLFGFPADPRNKKGIYDAARLGRPILIKQVDTPWTLESSRLEEERIVVEKLGIKSVIFAPLKSRGRVIGVLTVASNTKNFDRRDTELVGELAIRAGITIDKARLYSEAQEALRTRDEFLSIASHELRTPLTSILLNIQLILQKIRKTPPDKIKIEDIIKMLERSEQQSFRLSRLISDLLNISVASTGRWVMEKEQFDLYDAVKETAGRYEIQLKKAKTRIKIKRADKITGNWDKIRLEQVISNLISNAIKYGRKKPILIELSKQDEKAIIKVTDQGIGIKKSEQEHIFDRFKRSVSSKDYKGLGVGLYISKQIIDAHQGNLRVISDINKGSTFTIELPL